MVERAVAHGWPAHRGSRGLVLGTLVLLAVVLLTVLPSGGRAVPLGPVAGTPAPSASGTAVTNFSAAIQRLVDLVAAAGSGVLALVWTRVALSWFSSDITKKVQAKDRARDALVGTLLFTAAITGLIWGLAQWVLTGS